MLLKVKVQQRLFPQSLKFDGEFSSLITGLSGPTGIGKSTLLDAIAGIRNPDFCQISFDQEIWSDSEKSIFIKPQERRLAYVMQDIALFPNLTVQENIEFSRRTRSRGLSVNTAELSNLTNKLNLTEFLLQSINRLSGGQKQRVALARALYSKPRLLLLDEPFNGLDDASTTQAIKLVAQIIQQEKIQTIVVSHRRNELEALTDQIIVLK